MTLKPSEPADIGLKIGSSDEVFWTSIKTKGEEAIIQCKREIIIQRDVVKLAEKIIQEEQEKLKK